MSGPFRQLDPPPGGWEGARALIEAHTWRRQVGARAFAMAAALAVVFWLVWPRPAHAPDVPDWSAGHPDLAFLQGEASGDPVRLAPGGAGQGALLRVETPGHPEVVFYHVVTRR